MKKINWQSLSLIICIILFIWAVNKISHSLSVNVQPTPATVQNVGSTRDTVVQLPNNRIGIINGDPNNLTLKHLMMVFQYNAKANHFKLIGSFDYSKYINHPQQYGIKTDTNQ